MPRSRSPSPHPSGLAVPRSRSPSPHPSGLAALWERGLPRRCSWTRSQKIRTPLRSPSRLQRRPGRPPRRNCVPHPQRMRPPCSGASLVSCSGALPASWSRNSRLSSSQGTTWEPQGMNTCPSSAKWSRTAPPRDRRTACRGGSRLARPSASLSPRRRRSVSPR